MGKSVRYGRHGCCLPHNMQKAKRVNPSRSQTPYHWANKTGVQGRILPGSRTRNLLMANGCFAVEEAILWYLNVYKEKKKEKKTT